MQWAQKHVATKPILPVVKAYGPKAEQLHPEISSSSRGDPYLALHLIQRQR